MPDEFPKYLYHEDGRAAIVKDAEEQKKLGAGWHESPSEYGVETAPAAPVGQAGTMILPGFASERHAPPSRPVPPPAAAPSAAADAEPDHEPHGRRRS
jgi:hypothetical protein